MNFYKSTFLFLCNICTISAMNYYFQNKTINCYKYEFIIYFVIVIGKDFTNNKSQNCLQQ